MTVRPSNGRINALIRMGFGEAHGETIYWPPSILASAERVLLSGCSLQRIGILLRSIHPFHIVQRCRIGPSSLGESLILSTPSHEHPRQTEVSIMAPRLVIDPVRIVTLHGIFLL